VRTIRLELEYDGTGFSGWQVQPGRRTVQGELEEALYGLSGERVRVEVAGRTDAGVHALGQVASVRVERELPISAFCEGLSSLLPDDVSVVSAEEAAQGFHPRRSALGKWYRYLIHDRRPGSALFRDRAWNFGFNLDLAPMREAAGALIGVHDFSSFRSSTCEATSPVKEMRRIEIYRRAGGLVVIEMWGTAFLKQMARAISGTLVEVGSGRRRAGELEGILASRDRKSAGVTAPARGLYLVKVEY